MRRLNKTYDYYTATSEHDDYGEPIITYTLSGERFGWLSRVTKADIVDSGLDVDKITHVFVTYGSLTKGDKVDNYIIDEVLDEHRRKVAYLYGCE